MLIAKAAFALFEKRYDWRNPIRSVTIQAINLVPQDTPRQVDLFMNIEKIEKAERLDQCIETIRQRFGKNSIRNGILFQNLRMPSEKPEIKTVDDYSGYAQEGNMAVQARTRMDGICEKPDSERYRLSLLLTQLRTTGLQRLGKPFP